jgi:hypothetical protein
MNLVSSSIHSTSMSSAIGPGEFVVGPGIGFGSNPWASEGGGSGSAFGWGTITRPINVAAEGDKSPDDHLGLMLLNIRDNPRLPEEPEPWPHSRKPS